MDLAQLTAWIREYARLIGENAGHLTDLDAAVGDADHGINMERGMTAVVAALDESPPADAAGLAKLVGMTLVRSVGGASGPLYGTFFLRMATSLGPRDEVDAAGFAVFSLDMFSPRGVQSTADDQSAVPFASDVADGPQAVILPQVSFGIAIRMAVMAILAGGKA